MVAAGGEGGRGNTRFKSSVQSRPAPVHPGNARASTAPSALELSLLADVGLLGQPNAGKSTLLRAVSAARPKMADYPFTTLQPGLGRGRRRPMRSFVMADIPGLIEGAARGRGARHPLPRHVERARGCWSTWLTWRPSTAAIPRRMLSRWSGNWSGSVRARRPGRRLVLNKTDLVGGDEAERLEKTVCAALGVPGGGEGGARVYRISALTGDGTERLTRDLMTRLEQLAAEADAVGAASAANGAEAARDHGERGDRA